MLYQAGIYLWESKVTIPPVLFSVHRRSSQQTHWQRLFPGKQLQSVWGRAVQWYAWYSGHLLYTLRLVGKNQRVKLWELFSYIFWHFVVETGNGLLNIFTTQTGTKWSQWKLVGFSIQGQWWCLTGLLLLVLGREAFTKARPRVVILTLSM